MTTLSNIKDIEKIVRKHLISESEMPANMIRNALTTYGAALDKWLEEQQYNTVCECDSIMLFELRTRDNLADKSMTENDDSITFFKSYEVYVIIYGASSAMIANNVISRFRTQRVRQALYQEGVYLEGVTNDTSINEFKNDVMWHRHDFSINISCKLCIKQTTVDNAFDDVTTNIIKEGDKINE
jgi:hypothetical protein